MRQLQRSAIQSEMGRQAPVVVPVRPGDKALQRILLFLMVVLLVRATVFERSRDLGKYAEVDSLALAQASIVALCGLIVVVTPRLSECRQRVLRGPLRFLLYYYGFAALSAAWSSRPFFSLYRAGEYGVHVFLAAGIFSVAENRKAATRLLLGGWAAMAVLHLVERFKLGGYSPSNVSLHTNTYAIVGVFGFIFCFDMLTESRRDPGVLPDVSTRASLGGAFVSAVLALIGTSATAIVAAFAGFSVLALNRFKILVLFMVIGSILAMLSVGFLEDSVTGRQDGVATFSGLLLGGKSTDQLVTATGRTRIWERLWDGFKESPVVGYGFGVAEREGQRFGTVALANSHNAVISVAVNTGTVGLCLFGLAILAIGWAAYSAVHRREPHALGCFAVLVTGFVNSMAWPLVGSEWKGYCTSFIWVLGYASQWVWYRRDPARMRSDRPAMVFRPGRRSEAGE